MPRVLQIGMKTGLCAGFCFSGIALQHVQL